jgi:hypothetical protein
LLSSSSSSKQQQQQEEEDDITSMKNPSHPSHPWCCTVQLDQLSKEPLIHATAGDNNITTPFQTIGGTVYDITASADWMEFIEVTETRQNDEGGAGAYDTMRCDLIVKQPTTASRLQQQWNIWGEDYHLKRLENSFLSLLQGVDSGNPGLPDSVIKTAKQDSDRLLRTLMEQAEASPFMKEHGLVAPGEKDDKEHTWIQLIKLTLLWSLPRNFYSNNNNKKQAAVDTIIVRGHACSSSKAVPVFRSVQPIVVTVAALGHHQRKDETNDNNSIKKQSDHQQEEVTIDTSLPTRFRNPQSKVASWCKQRKKMDNPQTYKPPGVSEVLMVRPTTTIRSSAQQEPPPATNGGGGSCSSPSIDAPFSTLELLEGLSSNVFVIYKDGTLRTAHEGVLFGYVRHLVMEAAPSCGLKIDTTRPITLQDAVDGLWSEVFITSSSRLIWPIERILLPASSGPEACHGYAHTNDDKQQQQTEECEIDGFTEFWSDPVLTGPGVPMSTPQWQELLEEILRNTGYSR